MFKASRWHSQQQAVLWSVGFLLLSSFPALAQRRLNDINDHWAGGCIQRLASQQIVSGNQDGSFRPGDPVTRVEFALMISKAFPEAERIREPIVFADIPTNYWARNAIQQAYRTGFMSGYSGRIFNPNQRIPRLQALLSLTNGLRYIPGEAVSETLNAALSDAAEIPDYAKPAIAAAIERGLVVNYPNVRQLNPNQIATRADVAAFICQAIAPNSQTALVPSEYIASTSAPAEVATQPEAPTRETPVETPSVQPEIEKNPPVEATPAPTPPTETETISPEPETTAENPPVNEQMSGMQMRVAEAGKVRAEFSFEPTNSADLSRNLRLKVIRNGRTLLDELVRLPQGQSINNSRGQRRAVERISEGQLLGLEVVDLEGDREPEVMLNLATSAANNCCSYSLIYRYEPEQDRYLQLEQFWGNTGHQLTDFDEDGVPEITSADRRFSTVFNSQLSGNLTPLQIWHYRQGTLEDVTREYPEQVYAHTYKIWQAFNQRREQNEDVRGVLAAYLASKYLLDQGEEGWQVVQEGYQRRDRAAYFRELRQFLLDTGYIATETAQEEG